MSDEETRASRGDRLFEDVLQRPSVPARTPITEAARDFVFAEIWSRPGLDRRSRRWITLSCVCAAGSATAMRTYLRAALLSGDITIAELREFALHFAVFQGFPKAVEIELLVNALEAETS